MFDIFGLNVFRAIYRAGAVYVVVVDAVQWAAPKAGQGVSRRIAGDHDDHAGQVAPRNATSKAWAARTLPEWFRSCFYSRDP